MNVIEKATENLAVLTLESKLLQNNIISISGDITEQLACDFQNQIMYLLSPRVASANKSKTIQILINSYGGSVYAGLSIIDMINYVKQKGFTIEIVCTGVAMSMGAVILMCGTKGKRFAMPNSTIMIHELSHGVVGKLSSLQNQLKEDERIQKVLTGIITENSDVKEEEFLKTDLYLDTQEAIKKKIIDAIK